MYINNMISTIPETREINVDPSMVPSNCVSRDQFRVEFLVDCIFKPRSDNYGLLYLVLEVV